MYSDKRKTFQIKAQLPDTQSLKILRDRLPGTIQRKFFLRYGKILNLLKVAVQVEVITTLALFYDPLLRCFTFQDFKLAHALQEFGLILDPPRKKKGPYQGIGQIIKIEDLAMTLNIPIADLLLHFKIDREVQGLRRKYLGIIAKRFADTGEWESLGDVLALFIFGLIFFPNLDNFIDSTTTSVFWAVKNKRMTQYMLFLLVYTILCIRVMAKGND